MSLIKLPLLLLHSTLHNHSLLSMQPTYTAPILHLIGKAERWEVFFNTLLTDHLTGLWHAGLEGGELNMSRGKIKPQPIIFLIHLCILVNVKVWHSLHGLMFGNWVDCGISLMSFFNLLMTYRPHSWPRFYFIINSATPSWDCELGQPINLLLL